MVWEYPALVITDARDLTKNSGNPAFAHPKATTPHTRDAYCTTPHVRQNIMRDASKLFFTSIASAILSQMFPIRMLSLYSFNEVSYSTGCSSTRLINFSKYLSSITSLFLFVLFFW